MIDKIYIILILIFGIHTFGFAQPSVLIDNKVEDLFLTEDFIHVHIDSTKSLTIDEISSSDFQSNFQPIKNINGVIRQGGIPHWVKFTLKGDELLNENFVLENLVSCTHYITGFFVFEDGSIQKLGTSGLYKQFDTRDFEHKNFIYPIPKKSKVECYFKISTNHSVQCAFKVRSLNYFVSYSFKEYFYLAIFYGMLFIMIIINVIYYWWLKKRIILYFCVYVASAILFFFSEDGLGFQFFWAESPWFNYWVLYFSPVFFLLALILYSNQFLNIKKEAPNVFALLISTTILGIITYTISVITHESQANIPLFYLSFLIIYFFSIKKMKEDKSEKLFFIGFTFTMIGLACFIARRYLMLPLDWSHYVLLFYAMNFGVLIELVIFSFAQFRKISIEKKSRIEEMTALNNRFEHLFNNSLNSLIIYNLKTLDIININRTAMNLFNLPSEEFQKINLVGLFKKDTIVDSPEELQGILSDQKNIKFEATIQFQNFTTIKSEVSITNINFNNKTFGVLTIDDIRERVRANNLIKLNLEKLSTANQQLKEYIQSNNELTQFAYSVSHDLKQPVRTISSFSNLLKKSLEKKQNLNENESEYLDFILQGTSNMSLLINGLLEYSKVGSSKENQFSFFNVQDLITLVKSNLNRQITNNNALIIDKNCPTQLYGVKIKFLQLLQNLISNAIKFRKPDVDPIIEIQCIEKDDFFEFKIMDNGTGIPFEKRKSVFELFQRAHSNDIEGSGIGLATCQRIVEQHNGKIWIDPTFEDGTVFYFTIAKTNKAKSPKTLPQIIELEN